jgi:hypothetical protein
LPAALHLEAKRGRVSAFHWINRLWQKLSEMAKVGRIKADACDRYNSGDDL